MGNIKLKQQKEKWVAQDPLPREERSQLLPKSQDKQVLREALHQPLGQVLPPTPNPAQLQELLPGNKKKLEPTMLLLLREASQPPPLLPTREPLPLLLTRRRPPSQKSPDPMTPPILLEMMKRMIVT